MALKSTIYKATLHIADIDHGYYAEHQLTLARHPSETDERMMVRLVALALNAHELNTRCGGDGQWQFGAGLSNPDEPDVWLRDYTGASRVWVEVGQPDERPIIKACGKSERVLVYAFHHAAQVWWKGLESKLKRCQNLQVCVLEAPQSQALATLAERTMNLQATIQEGMLSFSNEKNMVEITPLRWL
ncbi:MAG: hypothetical protein RLZZ502_1021 [Pseudomonadota bacterium]